MLPSDIRSIHQAYSSIYEEVDLVTDELVEEVVEELIQECVEFGYELDEAADVVEEAAIEYLMELNPYAAAGSKEARAYQKSTTATKRGEERKAAVTAAKERVKARVKGAVAGAGIAASIAKDEARRAGRKAAHAVSHTVQKKKEEVKSGVKSLLGRGLRKAAGAVGKVAQKAAGAASRLGEEVEQLDEISDRKVQGMLRKRSKQDVDSGGISAAYMANRRAQQAAARRNQRTGSNVKVDPILSKEEVEQVSEAEKWIQKAIKEPGAFTKKAKAHGMTPKGFKKEVQAHPEKYPTETEKQANLMGTLQKLNNEVELDTWDVVLEYLITNGHADTNAEALYVMSQLDENAVQSIVEEVLSEKKGQRPQGLPYGPVGKGFRELTVPQRAAMMKRGKEHTKAAMRSGEEYSGSHAKSSEINSALRSTRLGGRG